MLEIDKLSVSSGGAEILKGIDLSVKPGEVVAVMGPNGSGKSTLARAVMGDSRLSVSGDIRFRGRRLNGLSADERAKLGIFMTFQSPPEIEGVKTRYFLDASIDFSDDCLDEFIKMLDIKEELMGKEIHSNFSGGEKKKVEVLQALLRNPHLVILDEIDSGLDIDSLKFIGKFIEEIKSCNKGVLIITHYTRVFANLKPDRVYVLVDGKISGEGGPEILSKLDSQGFGGWK